MSYTEKFDHIRNAVDAHTDLNIFASIVTILEGGHISSASDKVANRIIKICKDQQAKCLADYDQAVEQAGGGTYGKD